MKREMDIPSALTFEGTNAVLNAYNATTAYRNDVLLVAPGAHALTAELDWTKSNTHLVGMAGPNALSDYSEPGVSIYTITANVAQTVDLTGNYCQFRGANFTNNCDDADNLAAFNVNGYGAYFKNCSFHGIMGSTQGSTVVCASLYIDSLGSGYRFDDCVIGQNQWVVRTGALQGHVRYINTSGTSSANGRFNDCTFLSASETVTSAMVAIPHVLATDRFHLFNRCVFTNFSVNWGIRLNQVFYNAGAMQTTDILLKDCAAYGFDEWQDSDLGTMYESNMPVATVGGGLAKEPTAVVS